MKKRILSIFLIAALLLTLIPAAFAEDIEIIETEEDQTITITDTDEEPTAEPEAEQPLPAQPTVDNSVVYRALLIGEVSFSFETANRNRGDTELIKGMLENTVGPEGRPYTVTVALDLGRDGIRDTIGSTFADADDNDVSLFFIATHGVTDVASGSGAGELMTVESPGSRDGSLLLCDLADWLKAVPGKVIVVLGSCGSGAAIVEKGQISFSPETGSRSSERFAESVIRCFAEADESLRATDTDEPQTGEFRSNKFYVLTAAAHQESSWGSESYRYNFFPYYFALGANTGMPADNSGDGTVTLNEMYQYCLEKALGPYNDGTGNYYQHTQVYPENSSYPLFSESVTVASGTCGDNLTWVLNSAGALKISGTGDMWDFEERGAPWFEHWESIEKVVIENGVTSIGDMAFAYLRNMKSATIPDSVTRIGVSAFSSCTSLTSVTIPDGVTSISDDSFGGCSSLTSVIIPDSVTSIGVGAFSMCGLTSVTIPNSVESLGDGSFAGCSSLASVTIGNGVTSIGIYTFSGCSSLTKLTIPDSVTSINAWAFEVCSSLTSVTFKGAAPYIGDNCFAGVTATAYYPDDDASWTAAVRQNYGGTVTWLAYTPFIASGECGDDLTWLLDKDGVLTVSGTGDMWDFDWDNSAHISLAPWIPYADEIKTLVLEEGVSSIGEEAFDGCQELTKVLISDSVKSIGDYALSVCDSLTSVTLPGSVTSIGYGCFAWSSNLTEIRFEGSAPYFGNYCFYDITATVYYPASDTSWTSAVMQDYGGTITWVACAEQLSAPVLTEAFNSATGVRVSWKAVPGAVKYQLLRKNLTKGETAWTIIGETTELTLIDTTVASASRYTFTVQAVDADGNIGKRDETGRTCTYIAKADITNLRYGSDGVSITWSKPAGAKNFRVMRREDGTSTWTVLTVIEGTTYTDSTAKIGTKYWYTVRGVSMDNKVLINSYNSTGWSIKPLSTPVLTEAFNSATGVRVSWKAVTGAAKYRLLRKNLTKNETNWTVIAEIKDCTFIDTTAVSASRYTYTVECVDSNSRICTAQGVARTCTYIAMSRITAIGSVSNGVKLVWSQPAGAKNFRVFRKTDGGQWVAIKDVMGTSFVDTTAVKGAKYWYTVRAITLAGDMYINSYNATGWSVTRK